MTHIVKFLPAMPYIPLFDGPEGAGGAGGAGGNTPPAGGNTPPAGGVTPPAGGVIPPAGGVTPPAGGAPNTDTLKNNPVVQQLRQQVANLEAQLNNQVTAAKMSEEERTALTKSLEETNKLLYTKEELAKKERDKLKASADEERQRMGAERDMWRDRYTNQHITNELLKASGNKETEAVNPNVVVDLLRGKASLIEKLVDGKGTGEFDVIVKMQVPDKAEKGKMKELSLTPAEALKALAEDQNYAFMFKNGASGNGQRFGASGKGGLEGLNPQQYREMRRKGTL